jgi:hypothetical protein
MQINRWITSVSTIALATQLGAPSALAQQTSGVPGSPDATTPNHTHRENWNP